MSPNQPCGPLPLISWDFFALEFQKNSLLLKEASALEQRAKLERWKDPIDFREKLFPEEQVIVLTDPSLNIVHATANIYQMNGYTSAELLGKKPKIFQGKETCLKTSARISSAIRELRPFEEKILNYRKDGSSYTCWIMGQPVYNNAGELIHFIAFEKEVA
jgi:PAS domain S-box-containing protein